MRDEPHGRLVDNPGDVRALLLPSLAALTVALAAGCGGVAVDPVAHAAAQTANAGSFRFSFQLSAGASGTGQGKAAVTGDGAYDAASSRLRARVGTGGESAEVVLDTGTATVYVKPPAGRAGLPAGKTWGKIDLSRAAKADGLDLGPVSPEQLDPRKLVGALEKAGESTRIGKESLDGLETTHYRVVVDPAKALAQQPQQQREQGRKALALLGVSSIPVDAWVGDDGLLRRVAVELGGRDALFSLSARLDLSDYGGDVTVGLPPATSVADGTALLPGSPTG